MTQIFPFANVVTAVFLIFVGFFAHWVGQLISVLNWDLGTRLGLQEQGLLPEYVVYERAIAVADSAIGWIYGVTAIGLLLNQDWAYKLAWIPGSILIYHSIMAWFWEANRRAAGHGLWSEGMRITWCTANLATGLLCILLAWNAPTA